MRPERRWALLYLLAISAVFGVFYLGVGLRELGLALLMLVLNLPGSLLILPLSEKAAGLAGVSPGSPSHVWATQLVVMAINGALVLSARRVFRWWAER